MKIVTSDYIEGFGLPWSFRADTPSLALRGSAFIVNLDDKKNQGTHWTAARLILPGIAGHSEATLYYADPFGTMMNGWPPYELDKLTNKKVINRISFQRPSTSLCGYYAILFALGLEQIDRPLTQDQFERLLYNVIA